MKEQRDIDIAINALVHGASVALAKGGKLLASQAGSGVLPLITVLDELGSEAMGASLADKIIGKSVAMIAVSSGVVAVHAGLTSDSAVSFMSERRIQFTYDKCVAEIRNRTGDDMCPIEKLSVGQDDPFAVRRAIEARIADMSRK